MSDDFPTYRGEMEYYCLGCGRRYPSDSLLYTCPARSCFSRRKSSASSKRRTASTGVTSSIPGPPPAGTP